MDPSFLYLGGGFSNRGKGLYNDIKIMLPWTSLGPEHDIIQYPWLRGEGMSLFEGECLDGNLLKVFGLQ